MLQIVSTVENKTAFESYQNYIYNISISVQDSILDMVISNIEKLIINENENENEENASINTHRKIHIGHIQYANGRVYCDIEENEDVILHVTKFIGQVNSIKLDAEQSEDDEEPK